MRRVLAPASAAALLAASLAPVAQAAPPPMLTVGWGEPIDTLNPATTGNRDVGPLDANIFQTLIWLTPDLKVTPDLATSWSVSPDGKTYTLQLRHGVAFQDGTPFDAAAVVANIDYIKNPATQSKSSLSMLGPCADAAATGQYTVQIRCTAPYAPLLAQLGEPYLGMQSPKAIQTYGADLGLHPVGTGPFAFVSYAPNQNLVLKRFDAFHWGPEATHHPGPAAIAGITFDIVPTAQARIGQFVSGQSQMMQETPGIFWKGLQRGGRYTAVEVPISGLGIFAPIDAAKWPTDDPAVRRAILYATDRQGVVQLADDGAHKPNLTPIEPGMMGYDAALAKEYPYDPAKAASVLRADGWTMQGGTWEKGGRKLALTITAISTVSEYPLLAQAIQGYLRKSGMQAEVRQLATPAWLAANIKGDMSLTPLQYVAVDPDALHQWFLPGQYFNWSHVNDPKLAALIQQGQQELDPAKRPAIYRQIQQIIMDQAMMMPLQQNADLVMTAKSLTGLTWEGGGFEYFGAAALAAR